MEKDISRRDFLKGAAAGTASVAAIGLLGKPSVTASVSEAESEEETAESEERVVTELPIPEPEAPEQTEYSCDVLVVGGGSCKSLYNFPGIIYDV